MHILRRILMILFALPFLALGIVGILWTIGAVNELVARDVVTISGLGDIAGSALVAGLGIGLGGFLAYFALHRERPTPAA